MLVARYRIDRLLGVGAMGAVFKAHQLTLKRDVAIKVLHSDLTQNTDIAKRFKREAQSAARLEHPNIVQVLEYGSTPDGHNFIVMQLLEGKELNEVLGGPVPPVRAIDLILQVLSGLEHAHEHNVVHRDLKPENVFVTRDHEGKERLKLVDFGISKMIGGDEISQTVTLAGLVFGTPLYMSPEQATGSDVDARADLYSAGIILYEMLVGRPPFDHDDPVALIRMQVSVRPPPLGPEVPAALAAVVYRLLEKDRDARYTTAAEARHALEQVSSNLDAPAPHASSSQMPASASGSAPRMRGRRSTDQPGSSGLRPRQRSAVASSLLFASGTAIVGALAWAALPRVDVSRTHPHDSDNDNANPSDPAWAAGEVSHQQLAAIDRYLLAKQDKQALVLIKPLRDKYPDHHLLLWREGKAFALKRSKRRQALTRYADALDRNPALIEQAVFYAELYALLEEPRIREDAVDFALQKLGIHGHKFLLGLVNAPRPEKALPYSDRHRVLAELAKHPASDTLVDHQLNLARDLWQARLSPNPCENLSLALDHIATLRTPDEYFVTPLQKIKVPRSKSDADRAYCVRLEEKLIEVRTGLELALTPNDGSTGGGTSGSAEAQAAQMAPDEPAPAPTAKVSAPRGKAVSGQRTGRPTAEQGVRPSHGAKPRSGDRTSGQQRPPNVQKRVPPTPTVGRPNGHG